MELVLLTEEIDPLEQQIKQRYEFPNEGILSSVYKDETKANFFHSNPKSIYAAKQRVKSRFYNYNIGVISLLKFSVFISIIALMVS